MAQAYKEAFNLKRRKENEDMWINGAYTLSALEIALNNAFDKQKKNYLKKPYDLFPKSREEQEIENLENRNKLIAWLNRLAAMPRKE